MKRLAALAFVCLFAAAVFSQKLVSPVIGGYRVADADLIKIVKAEDSRDPSVVNAMLTNVNTATRYRAALAAGRIGSESSIDGLASLLQDRDTDVRAMAAFALGEIESIKAADAILQALNDQAASMKVVARAVEAAGKIAAANAKDPKAKDLGKAIVDTLVRQSTMQMMRDGQVTRLALTAALRARPEGASDVVAKFLSDPNDPRIRADAGNTLSRLRAKNANSIARTMLLNEPDGAARANAARLLGAAEDKDAVKLLLGVATNDRDQRVRVAAIRSLAALKDTNPVNTLIERMRVLMRAYSPKNRNPAERTELLEIATALSRLLEKTEDKRAIDILSELRDRDGYSSAETEIAFAHIAPKAYINGIAAPTTAYREWRQASAYGQGLADIASTKDNDLIAQAGQKLTAFIAGMATGVRPADQDKMQLAMPDLTNAMAALKPDNLDEILRGQLENKDPFIRAAAAGAMADRPSTKENLDGLNRAFIRSRLLDKHDNDASLAIMDAIAKLDKNAGVGNFLMALNDSDYLVRKKAFEILSDAELQKSFPGIPSSLESARAKHNDRVLPYSRIAGTFLGQVLSTDADYRRALSRKNGSIKAVFTTAKGTFTIVFNPEEAPLTVDNFVQLARRGYFNGLTVHRVVANFVMQDGDPRGDGNGGPGLSIRCEINMLGYDRGAVGMALSGKDTGGSQWFVTHSPQPHLDGGYTIFGHVSEADMKVVDNIVRGDKIHRVRIVGR